MPTLQHAIGQGRASCGWGSPLFRVEDEGDGRNDVRVARARPIVAKTRGSWSCGQMLPRRRDRASTRTWRSMGPFGATCLPAPRSSTVLAAQDDSRKIRAVKRPKLYPTTGGADNLLLLSRASYSAPGSYAHLDGHH